MIHQGRVKTLLKRSLKNRGIYITNTSKGLFVHNGFWGVNKELVKLDTTLKLIKEQGTRSDIPACENILADNDYVEAQITPIKLEAKDMILRLVKAPNKLVAFDERIIQAFKGFKNVKAYIDKHSYNVLRLESLRGMHAGNVAGFILRVRPSEDICDTFRELAQMEIYR